MADSTPPHEKSRTARLSLVLGTFTVWFVCALLGGGIYVGTLPVEPWAYVLVAVGARSALRSLLQKLGKGPGGRSATAILFALVKKSLLGVVALLVVGTGCDFARKAWPTIRTIVDIALASCQAHAAANERQLGGMTPAEWCEQAANFAPFLDAQRAASVQAQQALGLSSAPPMAGEAE